MMAIAIHITGLLSVLFITGISLKIYGRKPSVLRSTAGLAMAGCMGFLYLALTLIMSAEGNSWRLPCLLFLCVAMIGACVQPFRKSALISLGLFIYCLCLGCQYSYLARTSRYTDNPEWRLHQIRAKAKHEGKKYPINPNQVSIRATAHTWLTGLYRVDPPAGGESS